MTTPIDTLTAAGMDPKAAEVYLVLINNGEQSVPQILEHTELSRASVYDVLPELLARGYVSYRKDGREAFYKPEHPNKLFDLLEQKKRDTSLLEEEMKETIRSLTGSFNLAIHKPGVRYFEGESGIREALFDTLTATSEIRTFINLATISNFSKKLNEDYVAERVKQKKEKRILFVNDTDNKKIFLSYHPEVTHSRLLPEKLRPFAANMQIYDNKIGLFTIRNEHAIAIIFEDEQIAEMLRNIFDYTWELSSTRDSFSNVI